jgi:spore germination protein YaaH
MKKILIGLTLALILLAFAFINELGNSIINNPSQFLDTENNFQTEENYIFVPYWTFTDSISVKDYDNLIYFGITVNENEIDDNDSGYKKLGLFSSLIPKDKKTYLTLRLLDKKIQDKVLNDIGFQMIISEETILIAEKYGFDGIVIDFETSAFGFSSTEERVTKMYKTLQKEIKKNNLEFLVTVFGDSYYRARPYNIKEIGTISDKVIIMAYDFHKARLNPGPNFPLSGKDKYGYDLSTMINDFEKDLSFEKIVVALGYFGYDWKMENGVSVGMAEPLSLNQINSRFIDNCSFENCEVDTNNDLEDVVRYDDNEGFNHEVWFENIKSAGKKIEFLNSIGINQIASWAYSYY